MVGLANLGSSENEDLKSYTKVKKLRRKELLIFKLLSEEIISDKSNQNVYQWVTSKSDGSRHISQLKIIQCKSATNAGEPHHYP